MNQNMCEDCVRLLHTHWLVHLANCFWNICEENIGEGGVHGDMSALVFWSRPLVAFSVSRLLSELLAEKSWTASTFKGNEKKVLGYASYVKIE